MSQLQRFKFLVLPFTLWTGIGLVVVLLLRWFLEYFTGLVHINQSIWDYWIPFIVALLIWFFVLRVRFKMFYKPKWQNNQNTLIFMGINVFMGLVIMFGEFVLEYTHLKKQSIADVKEINCSDWNVCYNAANIEWNRNLVHAYNRAEVTGRHNDKMNYYAYFVAPMNAEDYPDTIVWIGKEYHISFSNRESDSYKDLRWNSFHKESLESFENLRRGELEFLMPVQMSGKLNCYTSALRRTLKYKNTQHRVFEFSSDNIYKAANNMLLCCGLFFILGIGVCFGTSFLDIANKRDYLNYKEGKYTITPDERIFRDALFFKGELKVTVFVGYCILLIYLIACARDGSILNVQTATNFDYGAMQKEAFNNGEYWRMFTSMFLHNGFMHISGNIILIIIFGALIEPVLGHWRFVILLILAGLGAEIVSFMYVDNQIISMGASGIVFGLFGWFVIAPVIYKSLKNIRSFIVFLAPIMLISFFIGLASSGVNNAAHIGGFFAGALLAFIIRPLKQK